MKTVLQAWSHAKTRPDIVNRRARRLYAEIIRSGGNVRVAVLARALGMRDEEVRADLATLRTAGLLLDPIRAEVVDDAA